jgi:precorrin-3B synthase
MLTGDGLLVRLIIHEPVTLSGLAVLCAAADEYGNGIVEVTQRGSLQVRGLTETSAPEFALAVTSLGIGGEDGPPLVTSPLLGLDPHEPFDSRALIPELLSVFKQAHLNSLSPKVSVLVDGGGSLHLDAVNADIRLVAESSQPSQPSQPGQPSQSGQSFQLSVAGAAEDATYIGRVSATSAPAAVAMLLRLLANHGPTTRARDLPAGPLAGPLAGSLAGALVKSSAIDILGEPKRPRSLRPPCDPLSIHALKDGKRALGVALPFGHTTAATLRRFIEAAADYGANSIRPASERALLVIGLSQSAAEKLREFARREADLIVDTKDARRHVVACAGSPACASARLSTRQLAPEVARITNEWVGTSKVIHLAGCSKGCAHPGPAALTVVGPDRIVVNGRASDPPHSSNAVPTTQHELAELLDQIQRLSHSP